MRINQPILILLPLLINAIILNPISISLKYLSLDLPDLLPVTYNCNIPRKRYVEHQEL